MSEQPSLEEIGELPAWAIAALAARAARRVLPFYLATSDDPVATQARQVAKAAKVVERAVHHSETARGVAVEAATSALGDSIGVIRERSFVLTGVAEQADADASLCEDAILNDIAVLRRLADHNARSPELSGDEDLLGPLWPSGHPEGWPSSTGGGLQLVFELPKDLAEGELRELCSELVLTIDSLYRAYGGGGLTIRDCQVTDEVDAGAPVDGGGDQ